MILSDRVEVSINGRNYRHYEGLGYEIPRYKDSSYRWYIKNGTIILVSIKDLLPKSKAKVLRKCDVCGEISELEFYQYRNICVKCATSGERNRQWRNGVSIKQHYCKDCGKKITYNSVRCLDCSAIEKSIKRKIKLSYKERIKGRSINGYDRWKRTILQNYNFTCQKCGYIGERYDGTLIAYHIENFVSNKDKRVDFDNGICLCNHCHKQFHKIYGKKRNNQIQLNEFLGE